MPKIDSFNVFQLEKLIEYLLDGEPVFIIRAQDVAAVDGVEGYIGATRLHGGRNTIRSSTKKEVIRKWQEEHPQRVKTAD